MIVLLPLLGALCPAAAQTGRFAVKGSTPAAPTVSLSTTATAALSQGDTSLMVVREKVEVSSPAVAAPAPPPPKPKRKPHPLRPSVKVGREAAEWEPYQVAFSTQAAHIKTAFSRQIRRVRVATAVPAAGPEGGAPPAEGAAAKPTYAYAYKGKLSKKLTSFARGYKEKDYDVVSISLFPKELKKKRTHIELRFICDSGFLEGVKLVAVKVVGGGPADDAEDAYALRKKGIEFEEDAPGGATIVVGHLDPKPDRWSYNAGMVTLASFGDKELGKVTFAYSLRGVKGS